MHTAQVTVTISSLVGSSSHSVSAATAVVLLQISLLNVEHNSQLMLLAARNLTLLADVLPTICSSIVRHGAVPALCARLMTIEYIDLAEQSLQVNSTPPLCLDSAQPTHTLHCLFNSCCRHACAQGCKTVHSRACTKVSTHLTRSMLWKQYCGSASVLVAPQLGL